MNTLLIDAIASRYSNARKEADAAKLLHENADAMSDIIAGFDALYSDRKDTTYFDVNVDVSWGGDKPMVRCYVDFDESWFDAYLMDFGSEGGSIDRHKGQVRYTDTIDGIEVTVTTDVKMPDEYKDLLKAMGKIRTVTEESTRLICG